MFGIKAVMIMVRDTIFLKKVSGFVRAFRHGNDIDLTYQVCILSAQFVYLDKHKCHWRD